MPLTDLDKLRIAIIQDNPTVGDIEGNLNLVKSNILQSKQKNADIVLFTEMFLSGYPAEDLVLKPVFLEKIQDSLGQIANWSLQYEVAIIIGAPIKDQDKIYNAVFAINEGKIVTVNYKQDLPNYAEFDEKRVFAAGEAINLFKCRNFSIALPICEDIWNENGICERYKEQGADLFLVANASPYQRGKLQKRHQLVQQKAKKLNSAIIYVNQFGGQDELVFDGASFACDQIGEVILQLPQFEKKLGLIDVISAQDKVKLCAAPEQKAEIMSDIMADYSAAVIALRDYVHKNGFKNVMLGLSGGIDSALCAAIAVDALGAENCFCFMLPYKYTQETSRQEAEQLARNLNCYYDVIEINSPVSAFVNLLEPCFAKLNNNLALSNSELWYENLQSRIRGVILMALSNKMGALLLTTGNKSELATGYCTIYGDMNGSFNVLKDFYKSEVYSLAKWRNNNHSTIFLGKKGRIIPDNIIQKPPSAELRENQLDQDSLPPYDVLDDILYNLIEKDSSIDDIVSRNHNKNIIKQVENLLYNSEYKRFQAAPGVRISAKNFGKDRRYPITNKFRDK